MRGGGTMMRARIPVGWCRTGEVLMRNVQAAVGLLPRNPPGNDSPNSHFPQMKGGGIPRAGESAFTTLLSRHGPMVLGVCRRVLRQEEDAADAFQATFLVLVRRGESLRGPDSLASWLYGVALRTARRARLDAARRRIREG